MTDKMKLAQIEDISERWLVIEIGEANLDQVNTQAIRDVVKKVTESFGVTNPSYIEVIVAKLQERFDISMTLGTSFSADDYVPWLDEKRGDIDWFFGVGINVI